MVGGGGRRRRSSSSFAPAFAGIRTAAEEAVIFSARLVRSACCLNERWIFPLLLIFPVRWHMSFRAG